MNRMSLILLSVMAAVIMSGCVAVNLGDGEINQGIGNGSETTTTEAEEWWFDVSDLYYEGEHGVPF